MGPDPDDLDLLATRQRAKADQASAGVSDLARVIGTFRKTLVDHGFATEQAFELARDYFNSLLDLVADEPQD